MFQNNIGISHLRLRGVQGADWLLTISIGIDHSFKGGGDIYAAFPQAHAVVDDFGTLVIVRGWK